MAIAVTTRSIVHSSMSFRLLAMIALMSLICCVFQFGMGRLIGSRYRPRYRTGAPASPSALEAEERGRRIRTITAGQSLGQKNTVFAIWMGYTFLTPETAIVGGFYSIWHNLYNSWQLRRAVKDND